MIIDHYIDMAGKHRIVWQMTNSLCLPLKFNYYPSDIECEAIEQRWIEEHKYDNDKNITIDITEDAPIIIDTIIKIRQNPNATLTQFTNYLNTKQWYEAATIRYFLYRLAKFLAQHYGQTLSTQTENEIYVKVRDWLNNQPIARIKKVMASIANIDSNVSK